MSLHTCCVPSAREQSCSPEDVPTPQRTLRTGYQRHCWPGEDGHARQSPRGDKCSQQAKERMHKPVHDRHHTQHVHGESGLVNPGSGLFHTNAKVLLNTYTYRLAHTRYVV